MPRKADRVVKEGPTPEGRGAGVVVTRDEDDDGPLTALLADAGFRVYHWPTIRFDPPEDPAPLNDALAGLDAFDWAVFTSPRAVTGVVAAAGGHATLAEAEDGRLPLQPAGLQVAVVGEATAAAVTDAGWRVDLVPEEATGEALVAALEEVGVGDGDRVFFPASTIARDVVPAGLAALGAQVTQVVAYRTVVPPLDAEWCRDLLESGAVEVVTFTSPSTVQNLQETLGAELFGLAVRTTRAVAIGPTTADAVRSAGFDEVAVAEPHSLEGLADRVADVAGPEHIQEAT